MSENQKMPLGRYVQTSLIGAWKFVQINPKAIEYLDISADGFWRSFWAIGFMLPFFLLQLMIALEASPAQILTSDIIFFFASLPLNALVMYYFTRFMNIEKNYAAMIIATNWVSAIIYGTMISAGILITTFLAESNISSVIFLMLFFYFSIYVAWFTYKVSLDISGALAIGVLLFSMFFSFAAKILLMQLFDPQAVELIRQQFSNQP